MVAPEKGTRDPARWQEECRNAGTRPVADRRRRSCGSSSHGQTCHAQAPLAAACHRSMSPARGWGCGAAAACLVRAWACLRNQSGALDEGCDAQVARQRYHGTAARWAGARRLQGPGSSMRCGHGSGARWHASDSRGASPALPRPAAVALHFCPTPCTVDASRRLVSSIVSPLL